MTRRARITKNEINAAAFNRIDNVHEKNYALLVTENDCILM